MGSFSTVLRKLRKQDDLTQTELGKALGLSYSTISMYERGEREPDFETFELIADYFNVDIDYLMGKTDIKNKYIYNHQHHSPTIAQDTITFPVIGDIAAGFDKIAVESWEGETVEIPLSKKNENTLSLEYSYRSASPLKGAHTIGATIKL